MNNKYNKFSIALFIIILKLIISIANLNKYVKFPHKNMNSRVVVATSLPEGHRCPYLAFSACRSMFQGFWHWLLLTITEWAITIDKNETIYNISMSPLQCSDLVATFYLPTFLVIMDIVIKWKGSNPNEKNFRHVF